MNSISSQIEAISSAIYPAQLLVVTKKRSVDQIREVLSSGVQQIGENRLQEIEEKYDQALFAELKEAGVELHFIGHLQTNKAAKVVQLCDVIQSVDSLKLAEKISQAAESKGKIMPIFLQVNATGEEQKHGLDPEELPEVLKQVQELPQLRLLGLMCMGKFGDDETTRSAFQLCKSLADQHQLSQVSMGMSGDYQIAVEEGSTLVRAGSVIFE